MKLSQFKCIPCQGDIPPLDDQKINELKQQLDLHWTVTAEHHLLRPFRFDNFVKAMQFANAIGEIAEVEGHHPNLHITWGVCDVEIWTHKINGLSESDFYLAAKIDELANRL